MKLLRWEVLSGHSLQMTQSLFCIRLWFTINAVADPFSAFVLFFTIEKLTFFHNMKMSFSIETSPINYDWEISNFTKMISAKNVLHIHMNHIHSPFCETSDGNRMLFCNKTNGAIENGRIIISSHYHACTRCFSIWNCKKWLLLLSIILNVCACVCELAFLFKTVELFSTLSILRSLWIQRNQRTSENKNRRENAKHACKSEALQKRFKNFRCMKHQLTHSDKKQRQNKIERIRKKVEDN